MDKKFNKKNYWENTDFDYLKSKKKVFKLLKILGIDTRYISYSPKIIYINDIRFSKFSKNREQTFKKYFPEIAIVRSTVFQKICSRASKILANKLNPKDNILLLKSQNKIDDLLEIVLEPYSRKYGISIFKSNFLTMEEAISGLNQDILKNGKTNIHTLASSLTLNEEVESILSNIFSGKGIKNEKIENEKIKIIYPFINVSNEWINLFFDNFLKNNFENKKEFIKNKHFKENKKKYIKNNNLVKNESNSEKVAISFMKFLDDIVPQYKENILKSVIYIKSNNDIS
ncbi:MAG: hypothetical protein FWH29_07250 [Methanobrevibacter sp.]|nr:hypothetical protein [Methanobrevibacter sp.]